MYQKQLEHMTNINILSFKSSIGWITLEEYNNKIQAISFVGKRKNIGKSKKLQELKKQINKFCNGKIKHIKANINLEGSVLQKKIWKEMSRIPYGSTSSYGDIAKKINTSPRYVGNVCGQNNHLLVIPCHRVIRSDGNLGGYSGFGGIELKKKLLLIEKNND